MLNPKISALIPTFCLLCSSCMVGPDFMPESPLEITQYTESPVPKEIGSTNSVESPVTVSQIQSYSLKTPLEFSWWQVFECEALNQLVDAALTGSPTIEKAIARLNEARHLYQAQAGVTYYPQIDINTSVAKQQVNLQSIGITEFPNPPPFTLYNLGSTLSYTLDLFGSNRRRLETLGAAVDYREYELLDAQVSLATNVVVATIQMSSLQEQLCLTQSLYDLQKDQVAILQKQLSVGGISELILIDKEKQLLQTAYNLANLQKQLSTVRHQIAVFLGESPTTVAVPVIHLSELTLPAYLPMRLPSELLKQRADVQAANALLHGACALVGVATAELFPKITLSGSLASQSMLFKNLFGPGTSAWNVGAGLLQPIFHGGELLAERRVAIALYDDALANYQNTVITAIQNVADTLEAIEYDAKSANARFQIQNKTLRDLEIACKQYQDGSISRFQKLDNEQAYFQAQVSTVAALETRFKDTATLFQALGGGWWHQAPCFETSVTTAAMLSATD